MSRRRVIVAHQPGSQAPWQRGRPVVCSPESVALRSVVPRYTPPVSDAFAEARERMVATQIAARRLKDPKCSPRCAGCRATASFRRSSAGAAYADHPLGDRPRPDDLAALHRRLHDRAPAPARDEPRARNRHRLRLPGGGARAARDAGFHHRHRGRRSPRARRRS